MIIYPMLFITVALILAMAAFSMGGGREKPIPLSRLSQKKVYRKRREEVMEEIRVAIITGKKTPMFPMNHLCTSGFGMMYQTDLDRQTNNFVKYAVDSYNHVHFGYPPPEIES